MAPCRLRKFHAPSAAHKLLIVYVTEFWKITHMGVREIIRIFMFSVLLIRVGNKF